MSTTVWNMIYCSEQLQIVFLHMYLIKFKIRFKESGRRTIVIVSRRGPEPRFGDDAEVCSYSGPPRWCHRNLGLTIFAMQRRLSWLKDGHESGLSSENPCRPVRKVLSTFPGLQVESLIVVATVDHRLDVGYLLLRPFNNIFSVFHSCYWCSSPCEQMF